MSGNKVFDGIVHRNLDQCLHYALGYSTYHVQVSWYVSKNTSSCQLNFLEQAAPSQCAINIRKFYQTDNSEWRPCMANACNNVRLSVSAWKMLTETKREEITSIIKQAFEVRKVSFLKCIALDSFADVAIGWSEQKKCPIFTIRTKPFGSKELQKTFVETYHMYTAICNNGCDVNTGQQMVYAMCAELDRARDEYISKMNNDTDSFVDDATMNKIGEAVELAEQLHAATNELTNAVPSQPLTTELMTPAVELEQLCRKHRKQCEEEDRERMSKFSEWLGKKKNVESVNALPSAPTPQQASTTLLENADIMFASLHDTTANEQLQLKTPPPMVKSPTVPSAPKKMPHPKFHRAYSVRLTFDDDSTYAEKGTC